MSNQTQQPMFLSRRQRREMLRQNGILKVISKMNFLGETRSKIRQQNMEQGRKMMQARADQNDKLNAERLEATLERMKETWASIGYNDAEMTMLEEAWSIMVVKDMETYKEDKKRARQLTSEAQASRAARLNG